MCGIAGILRTWRAGEAPPDPRGAIPEAWLDTLDDGIKHRGPDGQGRFRQRVIRPDGTTVDVALVHRRLSIIDHADGAQPMLVGGCATGGSLAGAGTPPLISREAAPYQPACPHPCPKCGDGVVAVVFNGCIYNHRELRTELEAAGHVFCTDHSDTEVLLHGWRHWGESLFEHVEGMYGLALWDSRVGTLHIARDLFGEKPLYHTGSPGHAFTFASSTASLVRLTDAGLGHRTLSAGSIAEWIALGYAPEATPFEGIAQLHSGERLSSTGRSTRMAVASLDRRTPAARFGDEFVPRDGGLSRTVDQIDQAIERAVARRLEADVPLACFLSGGLDSSLVARAAVAQSGTLITLCVRMPSEQYDESGHAARIAKIIGTDHHEIQTGAQPAEDLARLIPELGLPFGDSSLLPTHWVSRAAAEQIGVAVGGDGGDELFLGYERYSVAGDLPAIHAVAMLTLGLSPRAFNRRDPKSATDKAARLLTAAQRRSYRSLLAIHQHPDLRRLIGDAASRCRWDDRAKTARLAQRYDLESHLPGDLLRKVDTASMACALEVRSPLLDRELAALTLRMSTERLRSGQLSAVVSHAQRKGLLKAVARKHFPSEIVDRPKMGFAIPIGEWFRTDYGGMRQLLYDHLEAADPFPGLAEAGVELNRAFIARMLREHDAAGERSINPWHGRDHSQRLYMLLVLSIWCRWLRSL